VVIKFKSHVSVYRIHERRFGGAASLLAHTATGSRAHVALSMDISLPPHSSTLNAVAAIEAA